MTIDETSLVLAFVTLLQGANFWFLGSMSKKVSVLCNGCFQRHLDLAKQEGKNEKTLDSLHERIDRVEEEVLNGNNHTS